MWANLSAVILQSGMLLTNLLPWVLAGCLVGTILIKYKKYFPLQRLLTLPVGLTVILSAVLGCLSPMCTLGSVPMVIGLIACGLPAAAAVSFIVTSSLLTPQMILIAVSAIGLPLTAMQTASGLLIGILAGFMAMLFQGRKFNIFKTQKKTNTRCPHHKKEENILMIFLSQLEHILLFVVAGALVASVVNVFVPASFFYMFLSRDNPLMLAGSALTSIPGYTCGGGVFPLMGTLLARGVSPGIVLTFILAGPATRLQAIAAVGSFFTKPALVGYIGFILVASVAAGLIVTIVL